jgi:hypothetical protein
MQITLEVPDEIVERLEDSLALEGYRSGKFTEEQVRRGPRLRHSYAGAWFPKGAWSLFELRPGGPGAGQANSAAASRKRADAGLNDCHCRYTPLNWPNPKSKTSLVASQKVLRMRTSRA